MNVRFLKDFTSEDEKCTVKKGEERKLKSVITPNADTLVNRYVEHKETDKWYRVTEDYYEII